MLGRPGEDRKSKGTASYSSMSWRSEKVEPCLDGSARYSTGLGSIKTLWSPRQNVKAEGYLWPLATEGKFRLQREIMRRRK